MTSPWTRRRWLAGSGLLFGSLAARVPAAAPADRSYRTVSIFHTTDLHGHILPATNYDGVGDLGGLARCATQIRRWRQESPDHLLVDLGDIYQGTPEGWTTKGRILIDLLNRLGYHAWVPGNHDLDWGREAIDDAVSRTTSAPLCANLTVDGKVPAESSGPWRKVAPFVVKEVGGFRLALVGLTTPGLPDWIPAETLGGLAAVDPVEALAKCMPAVKAAKPDAVIVLGHMGWKFQDDFDNPVRSILRTVRGIDVYLAGHSHQDQPAWVQNGVLCSQASYHGIHCGRVDLTFDADSRKLIDSRAFTVLMDGRFAPDPEVLAAAAPETTKAAAEMARPVAELAAPLTGGGRDSQVGNLLCRAFAATLEKSGTRVDGVFHGTFGTGDLASGTLTVSDCWRLLPYENLLVVAAFTGEQLAEIVREDAAVTRSDRRLWGFEIGFDPRGKIARFLHRGKPVADLQQRFVIACNSYDSQSGGGRLPLLRQFILDPASQRRLTGIDTRSALIGYLLDRKRIDAADAGS